MNRFQLLSGVVLASFALAPAASAGSISFNVSVDSSSLAGLGQSGYIDLQFNETNTPALSAIATITDFSSTPDYQFDNSSDLTSPGISGDLLNPPLVIPNDNATGTEFDEAVTSFGSGFSFNVVLSGDAIGGADDNGSSFFLTLFDPGGGFLIDQGPVASILVNADGSVTPVPGDVSTLVQTPEPATWLTGGVGALLLLARRKKR